MDLELKDKVAFIAGSSRGIGAGIAESFLREGANTVITGRDGARLAAAEKTLGANYPKQLLALQADLADLAAVKKSYADTLAKWNQLDAVVINVGSGKSVAGWDVPQEEWDSAFDRNFWTSIHLAQEALRVMIPLGQGGSITFITSIAGLSATAAPLAYSAAKAALGSYTANLATLAAPHNVRVNCVAPGNIRFPGGSWDLRWQEREADMRDFLAKTVPQNRFGTTQEIGDIVAFLASPRASFVTGACWIADGGQTRKL